MKQPPAEAVASALGSPAMDLQTLQQRLGHAFGQTALLQRALTHKSFGLDHYERLEFLGDAVLDLGISDLLYSRFERSAEGDLTRVRAHLVRQDMLHRLAVQLGLPAVLRLSEGEAKGGGAQRPSILADALEAIIGAVYLDAGFDAARALVVRLFEPVLSETHQDGWSKDAKTALQEWLQARKMPVPVYRIDATRGEAHEQGLAAVAGDELHPDRHAVWCSHRRRVSVRRRLDHQHAARLQIASERHRAEQDSRLEQLRRDRSSPTARLVPTMTTRANSGPKCGNDMIARENSTPELTPSESR